MNKLKEVRIKKGLSNKKQVRCLAYQKPTYHSLKVDIDK